MSIPWIRKYLPKKTGDIVGQKEQLKRIHDFIANYKKEKKKALLVYGPTGCGKTSVVYTVANEFCFEVVEVNASDFRNKDMLNSIVGNATKQRSLFSKGKVILVDEVDGLSGREDRGGVGALVSIISTSAFPIIATATDPFDQSLSSLRKECELLQLNSLSYLDIYSVLVKICIEEKIHYNEMDLKSLARMAGGDLRAAINDLQSLASETKHLKKEELEELSQRQQKETMFDAMVKIFKVKDLNIALSALDNVDEDMDKIILWLDENVPLEYTKPEDLARAYECLSRSDVFKGRISRWQHWRFLVYINALLTAGITSAKDEKNKSFVQYKPYGRLLKLWQANMKYRQRKEIAAKISAKTHTSKKRIVKDIFPYIKHIVKHNKEMREKIAQEFELDNEEVEWMRK